MIPSNEQIAALLTARGQPFEMEERTIHGVPLRSWKNAPPTLRHVLEASRRFSDRIYIAYEGEQLTYDEHYRRAAVLAGRLVQDFGIRKGDRVAIAMRNFPEWAVAFWATVSIGAIVVPLNAWWTAGELEYALADSGARLLFADRERAERLAEKLQQLELAGVIVARSGQVAAPLTGLEDLLGGETAQVLPAVSVEPDDDATILYTSGTTGRPKGALGTHLNICSFITTIGFLGVRALLRAGGTPETLAQLRDVQSVSLLTVPLFHVAGCHGALVSSLATGGKVVMMHKWEAKKGLELIERESVTTLNAIPTMIWQMVDHPDIAKRNLASLKVVAYGGAPAAPELRRRVAAAIPAALAGSGYGITECSAVISGAYGEDYAAKPDAAGTPAPVCDVIAVDDRSTELPRGMLGELWVRGPNVVKGYWNNPDATAQTFSNGWFHTGDIGKIDAEGCVYIVDRKKDMIIRGGENVYCAEVEAALLECRSVKGAAVIGLPHRELGEEVGAVVQVDPECPVSAEELQAHARSRLAAFKVPTRLWLRTEPLPLGPTGKVLKRDLREQVLGRASR
jgi:long-chain acyl-CoA synthetase